MAPHVDTFVLALQVLLAVVFATAGVGKLLDRAGSRTALTAFGVPDAAVPVTSYVLPAAELATAIALVFHATARWGALAALVLLMGFTFGIARALSRGEAPDCHCFGQIHSAPAGRGTLARNAVLAVLAAVVVVHGPGTSLDAWVEARTAAELAAVAIGIVTAVLATVCVRLWLDKRELSRELDREREVTALFPPGLPLGAEAPPFTLEDTQGHAISLHALLEPGRPLALVFISPGCGPCEALLPDLARWQATLAERLTIGLVSTGDVLDNYEAQRLGLTNVFLQDGDEIMKAYRVESTPSAVMVSSDGRVASSVTLGGAAIEPLIRVTLRHQPSPAGAGPAATNGASTQRARA
jgi:uncharacterized membrane protein YphA (DoxX/SURF4 family)/thiol-disulfide isomerase/thioredoxin